jgi:hypothetical protein
MSKLQEKTSALKREHPALQKMKVINFFQCLWVIFALLDPDTDQGTPLNPDPQHCLNKTTRNLNNLNSAATKPQILYKQKIKY